MSERMFIKEEKEEFGEAMSSASSFSTSLSTSLSYSTSSPSLSVSVPPTQRVLPSTPSLRSVTGLGWDLGKAAKVTKSDLLRLFNGPSSKPETVVDKTKKFLAALVKFATSVSPAVGTNVRKLVFRLAVGFLFLNQPEDEDKVDISILSFQILRFWKLWRSLFCADRLPRGAGVFAPAAAPDSGGEREDYNLKKHRNIDKRRKQQQTNSNLCRLM